jgi:endonuclease YncB( thermonuclease family)
MRFIFRLITSSIIRELTRKPSLRFRPTQAIEVVATEKKKALSELAIKEIVTSLPKARVISVIDGDTVIVAKDWNEITIRLDSIDCPEDG